MATTPNNPWDEKSGAEEEPVKNPVLDALHQVWLASLGVVAVAGEEAAKIADRLVEKGKEVEPQVVEAGKKAGAEVADAAREVGSRIRTAADKIGRRAEAAESMLDERVRATLERMGYATRNDVESLSAKLDALTAKLEEFASRRRGPTESGI